MKYTILNVDDHDATRYIRSRALRGAGFDLVEAATAVDAIGLALERRPQVVILDVHLPDLNGIEVCRRIKTELETASVQVLHISPTAVTETARAMALENGADAYLVEPVDPGVLLGSVRALIRQWQKQADLRAALQQLEATRQALQQSDQRFRMAIEASKEAIWDLNLETGKVTCNDTYSELFGRPADTSPLWWLDHIHPDDRQRVADGFQAALHGNPKSWDSEYRFQRLDGSWAHIVDRALIARSPEGKALRIVGAMLDVTELMVAREQLSVLTGLLPICAWCKKMRDDDGTWQTIEQYIGARSHAKFSHGMCPDCATRVNQEVRAATAS